MKTYFVAFLTAFVAVMVFTRLARSLGHRLNLTDQPDARKVHTLAVPRIGGPAVMLAFFLPVYGLLLWNNTLAEEWREQMNYAIALLVGGVGTVLLGLWDDIWTLRARYKLILQIAIAVTVYFLGVQIRVIDLPLFGHLDMGVFALPVTVLWILGFMNAVNLIDGVDGLCAGVVFIASLSIFIISLLSGRLLMAVFMAALAGSTLGFLRYNFNPATIFLGDSGSYFLGFVLAVISIISSQKAGIVVSVLAPVMAMGLPIMDMLLAILRRAIAGRPIFAPDRGHLHHRLLDKGYHPKRVVLTLYGLSALFTVVGLITLVGQKWEIALAVVCIAVIVFLFFRIIGFDYLVARESKGQNGFPKEKADVLLDLLPDLYGGIENANKFNDVTARLADFAQAADIERVDLHVTDASGARKEWSLDLSEDGGGPRKLPLVVREYPLVADGRTFGLWRVALRAENGWIGADTQALFKLSARLLAKRLKTLEN